MRTLAALLAVLAPGGLALATPYTPASDAEVLAEVPLGTAHASVASRDLSRARADVALPLAQFYIARARASGDLRDLGYAEGVLLPWVQRPSAFEPTALVLHATILQSRHAFGPALEELDRALSLEPGNGQGWLTRATILRVLGRYAEATASCRRLKALADPAVGGLCEQSIRALNGHLADAYAQIEALPAEAPSPEVRAWRDSELGEMAERRGEDAAAERWLRAGLALAPQDFYLRSAYADLLLRGQRPAESLALLSGYESFEPLLLRIAIARRLLGDPKAAVAQRQLADAFHLEEQRGEAVHRREQARFLLDVELRPQAALAAATENWRVQREPDDLLILLRAAQAARSPEAAAPALEFLREQRLEDVRLKPYLAGAQP